MLGAKWDCQTNEVGRFCGAVAYGKHGGMAFDDGGGDHGSLQRYAFVGVPHVDADILA